MTPIRFRLLCVAAALAVATAAQAQAPDEVTITLGGDMIGPFHALPDPPDAGFDAVRSLFRTADMGLANQEGSIFDLDGFAGFPAPENGGGYPRQPKSAATDIRSMGIGLVSKANNHATDWGAHGLAATLQSLDGAGIGWAGAGTDAATACGATLRGPTPDKAIAMVSAATTFPPMALPSAPVTRYGRTSPPAPGICGIHVQAIREVTQAQLDVLKEIAGPLGMSAGPDGKQVRVGDQRFRAAAKPGVTWEMKPEDLPPVLSAIAAAEGKAAAVVFAVHAHETAGTVDDMPPRDFEPLLLHRANEAPGANEPTPADFIPRLFHQAIDAGADVVMRTGPHLLGGIEIYKDKPIFYGLGSLVFDFGGRRGYTAAAGQSIRFPAEWFETVVPVVTLHGDRLREVRLYPATIDPEANPTGGLPRLAKGADAARILARLQGLSRPYGTTIRIAGDVGIIEGVIRP